MPCVLQSVDTFISSGDIKAGERWQNRINNALNDIDFGVVFISESNKDKPWIMFETGALAKNLGVSRVVPVLCDSAEINFVGSPLLQFQYVKLDRDGVFSLMESLRESLSDDDATVDRGNFERIFEVWWPSLETELSSIEREQASAKPKSSNQNERLDRIESALSEILRTSRVRPRERSSPTSEVIAEILSGRWDSTLKTPVPSRMIVERVRTKEEAINVLAFLEQTKSPKIQKIYRPRLIERFPDIE